MQSMKAHVHNGRLVLDEPTDLPKGALHQALRESIEQMKRGETIDAREALAELRAHR